MKKNHVQLEENALSLGESIVMGVAGTAPAYSLAATTSVLIATVGLLSLASLFYCGLIMFGVTLAFLHLNRAHTCAGASYSWVGQVFHPILGFFSGWSLLVATVVFMVSGTIPAATATLALVSPEHINSPFIVALVAAGWLLFVSAIVIKGIKLSSYFQVLLTVLEIGLLVLIIGGAFWAFSSSPIKPFDWSQFSITHFTVQSFATGTLTALFFFWGWDVTVNLSEETRNAADNPGRGAVASMFIVLFLFLSFIIVVQFAFTDDEIKNAGTNLLFVLSDKIFPRPWSYVAVIAVVVSTVGTLETSILQFTRTMFAKGRDGILHPRYAQLHKTWKTPWRATMVITSIGLILLAIAAFFPTINKVIEISVQAIGFQIAFYYGLACFACAWRFRLVASNSVGDFILLLVWPILSGCFMAFIFISCAFILDTTAIALGIGGIAIGAIPLLLNKKLRRSI